MVPPDDFYVLADDYVRLARVRLSGRTLQRWCDQNPFLAERLREIKFPRRRLYDGRTAKDFRRHWMAAEVELRRGRDETDERFDSEE
jgi:hypothetical protein